MRTIEEIRNNDRVYDFKRFGDMFHYSFLYTFKKPRVTCSVIVGVREPAGGRKFMEHASLSIYGQNHPLPTWEQMCEIKDLIWQDEEECYQVFPKKSEYVHSFRGLDNVMHIWRDVPEGSGEDETSDSKK